MSDSSLLFLGIFLLIISWLGIRYLQISKKEILFEKDKIIIPAFGIGLAVSGLWKVYTWGKTNIVFEKDKIVFFDPLTPIKTIPKEILLSNIKVVNKGLLPWGNLYFERNEESILSKEYVVWFANKRVLRETLEICQKKGIPLSPKAAKYLSQNR